MSEQAGRQAGRQTRDQRRGVQKKCVGVEVGL